VNISQIKLRTEKFYGDDDDDDDDNVNNNNNDNIQHKAFFLHGLQTQVSDHALSLTLY
jgi:hypothetical protein